jgi:hypothetical protein
VIGMTSAAEAPLTGREILTRWLPLAASWMVMGIELPLVSAVMARLADPTIHLAAYGGVVFPVALIIEAPIIMLLAASTALSKDLRSYRKVYRFMMWAGGLLTVLHALLAFTPLFDLAIVRPLGPPPEIVEPARLGLMIMLPWTWTIAYRRFHQGLLIRFDRAPDVTVGTVVRLLSVAGAVALTLLVGDLPGIAVATIGIAAGVTAEAIYTGIRARPVVVGPLVAAPEVEPLRWRAFYGFYVPLAATSLLLLLVQPLGSAAIARLPQALESLAVWPVLMGLLFIFRSIGFAFNEVVVALMDRVQAPRALQRFATLLAGGLLLTMLLITATPFARFWFETVSGLDPELAAVARRGLWLGLLLPTLDAVRNYFQGTIVHSRHTRSVTEAMVVFLIVSVGVLAIGLMWQRFDGVAVATVAFTLATTAQIGWLARRSRPILRARRNADLRAAAAAD